MNTGLTATAAMEVPQRDTTTVRLGAPALMPGSRTSPGTGPGVESGFGALMSAMGARGGRVGMIAPGGERASPERMFDAPPNDPGERRQATMRDDYREGAAKDADALRDRRTGIEARRASRPMRNDGVNGAQPSEADAALRVQVADRAKPASFQGQTAVVPGGEWRSGHEGQAIESPAGAFKNVDRGENFLGRYSAESYRTSQGSSGGRLRFDISDLRFQKGGFGGGGTSTTSANTAAGEAARLLAGAQVNDVESIAAPAAASPGGDVRSVAREPTDTGKARPNASEQSAASQSPAKKTEDVSDTPFAQLVRLMRSQAGRQSSARVMLEPPELGRIHVRVRMLGDRVEVGVETETKVAKELISGRAERLRSALEHHGMIVDRLDINTNATGLFDQREAIGDGSGFTAQGGGERFVGGWRARSPSDKLQGVGTSIAGSGVFEWSDAEDARLDIRV